jgi:hypothetical protein
VGEGYITNFCGVMVHTPQGGKRCYLVVNWIKVTQDRIRWRTLTLVLNLRVLLTISCILACDCPTNRATGY